MSSSTHLEQCGGESVGGTILRLKEVTGKAGGREAGGRRREHKSRLSVHTSSNSSCIPGASASPGK